jgi:hypothetical protein
LEASIGAKSRGLAEIRRLAEMTLAADDDGLMRIAHEANRVVLGHRLEADEIMLAIAGCGPEARRRLLTGSRHIWTADEVAEAMKTDGPYCVKVLREYKGRTAMLDLTRLVADINAGKYPPPGVS